MSRHYVIGRRDSNEGYPPRTRGGTPLGPDLATGRQAEPAYAGMNQSAGSTCCRTNGFPHSSGDAPDAILSRTVRELASPYTRG